MRDHLDETPREEPIEQCYSPQQLGRLWGFSDKTIIRLFRDEPGVMILGRTESFYGKKRAYASIRIPASVALRVAERMTIHRAPTLPALPATVVLGARAQMGRNRLRSS